MKDQMKQALIKETERYIAQDILYDDVYVGSFTEKDGVDCAIHAVDWYRNNIWHDASEKPKPNGELTKEFYQMKILVVHTDAVLIHKTYDYSNLVNVERWAYMDDLVPNKSK